MSSSRLGASAWHCPHRDEAPLAPGEGLDAGSWATIEFAAAPLGDARLSARLVESAHHMAQSPMRAIIGAANGARAVVKGHCRLMDQPADSEVTIEHILAPHRERTRRRMQSESTVLCIQNTTTLSFTRRGQTQGLGTIGSNQTGALARGLHLHTTLAVNPDGVPLGVLRAGFGAPSPPEAEGPKAREEKKSFRWIEGAARLRPSRPQASPRRAWCAPWTARPTSSTCSSSNARTPRTSSCWCVRQVNRVVAKDTTPEGDNGLFAGGGEILR